MPNTIQPREYSRGGGRAGILYITDSDGNLNVRYLSWYGDRNT